MNQRALDVFNAPVQDGQNRPPPMPQVIVEIEPMYRGAQWNSTSAPSIKDLMEQLHFTGLAEL